MTIAFVKEGGSLIGLNERFATGNKLIKEGGRFH